jgi:dTDP-4-amino-4,6-dideoxygalactose transaminase
VVTNDFGLAKKIRSLSNHGRSHDDPHRHELVGANHRLDALQAAILSVKLKRLDAWNTGRGRAAKAYAAALAGLPVQLVNAAPGASSCHHLTVVRMPHRDEVRRALATEQISTGLHYPVPCHRQTPFITERRSVLPVVETAADQILSLPMFPHLTDTQIGCVADAIFRALSKVARHERPELLRAQDPCIPLSS